MEEIKKRTEVVNGLLTGEFHTKYIQTTAESICLQIRKILELIAMASLVANRSEYTKYRKNFYRDWNAKREFVTLYDMCGGILHADNPFSQKRDVQPFLDTVPVWMNKIVLLLNHHQIQLIDDDQQIWVLMQEKRDGKVHVYEFERIGVIVVSDAEPQ